MKPTGRPKVQLKKVLSTEWNDGIIKYEVRHDEYSHRVLITRHRDDEFFSQNKKDKFVLSATNAKCLKEALEKIVK